MLGILRRLALGLVLIAAAAALLLFSDLRSRTKPAARVAPVAVSAPDPTPSPTPAPPARQVRVALLQHASQLVLDQGRNGMLAGLAERGWIEGKNLQLRVYNAQGDMPVAQTIAKEMASGGYDLLLSISTPSLQAVANANKAGPTPHVFALVTDPYGAGVGINRANHLDHPAHLAGYGTMQPVALAFKTARELNPALATVGVVWNAAEANSEAQLKIARQVSADLGLTLLESTVDNSAGVAEAANALVARGVDALWMPGDVTVMSAVDAVIGAARKGHIPAFSVIPPNVKRGALFDVGADYPAVGRLAGLLAADILDGRSPASVSIENVMPEVLAVNLQALAGLKPGWSIPAALRDRAQLVIDETGAEHAQGSSPVAASVSERKNAVSAQPAPARKLRVALLQHTAQPALDEGRDGVIAGLADRGWVDGKNLELRRYDAGGDMPVALSMAKEMVSGGYDLLLTITTPSTQAVANANQAGKTRHVFGIVNDPYSAGLGISRDNHLSHPAHLAGYATLAPVALAFKTARELNPALATVGVVWNPAEANSESQVKLARAACADLGLKLEEAAIENSAGVGEAAAALVARGVDALWAPGDSAVMTALESIVAAARKGRIPVFTVIPPSVKRGTLFDLGANFGEVGRLTGQLAGDILSGRDPATVPVDNVMPENLTLNLSALAGLKAPWTIPDSLRQRAQLLIDESGTEHAQPKTQNPKSKAQNSAAPARSPISDLPSPTAAPGRLYRIAFAAFAPEPSLETCQRGLLDGLKDFGFVEGRNLVVNRTHAQGEMVNIPQMIQNLDSTDADVLVSFSTPVLQSALAMAKHKPVVFTYVTDPLAAGAGKSFTDHAAHVTGIGSLPPIDDTVQLIRRVLPQVRRLGTIYNSSEANSVKIISLLRDSAQRAGLDLVELTAANSNEVLQAMQALVARRIDAFYLPSDNTAYLAYDAIRKVAQDARLALIVDDPDYVERGALFACGPGFYHSGRAAAPLLARVLLGESPVGIPMANVSVNATRFNRETVAKLGLPLSPDLLREIESGPSSAPVALRVSAGIADPSSPSAPVTSPPGGAVPPPRSAPAPSPNSHLPSPNKKWKIAYVLYNETPPAEQTLAGMKDAWARSALVAGRDYEIKVRSAQGDMASLSGIIDATLTDGADIIVPLSTPTLQLAVKKVKGIPLVFTLVANPMAAGAGRSYTDHLPNVTGIATLAPFGEALELIQQHFPDYRRLGTVFCPAEANSVDLLHSLEAECRRRGLTLESVAANTASDLPDAALALAGRSIDAIVQLSDNLSSAGFTAIARAARQAKKPLFSLNSTTVPLGAAVAFGRDYHNAGEATVALLERVIRGGDPSAIPFALPPKIISATSEDNARAVGMPLPPAFLRALADRAAASTAPSAAASVALRVSAGIAEPRTPISDLPSPSSPASPAKKWKIALILYNETPPAEETLAGMKEAWARSSFVEGRDYEIKFRSAQGDMALLSGIFDAALTDGADLVVTLSTPTLQMAVKKVKRVPIVFALVTNPMAAGAGKSYTDHLPNVTGIAVLAPVGEALDMIKQHFPAFRRIGTLYCPAEANAVYLKEALAEACQQRGLALETVAVNTATELPDSALSLMARNIDVVLQIPDALSSTGFTAITRAARQSQKPLFALNGTVVPLGAAVALGRDFHNSGEAAVALIERIFRGEDPAAIPFMLPPKVTYIASPANARAVGVVLPPALLKEVDQVLP